MTPTEQDKELRELVHIVQNADTTYDAMQFIKADRKRVELEARIEAQKEILAFATRVQANGQYIPIEVGLIPWLEAQLSNTHKEQL